MRHKLRGGGGREINGKRMSKGKELNVQEVQGECQHYCFLGYDAVYSDSRGYLSIKLDGVTSQNTILQVQQEISCCPMRQQKTAPPPSTPQILKQTSPNLQHN
jgi:hypothetical protein